MPTTWSDIALLSSLYLQEDGTSYYLLEDGTSFYLLEDEGRDTTVWTDVATI